MKYKFFLFFLFLSSCRISAQSFFQVGYHDQDNSWANAFTKNATGGYCIIGQNENNNLVTRKIIIYNIDAEGTIIWSKKIEANSNEYSSDIKQTLDKGYIFCGSTTGGTLGGADIFIAKIDSAGSIIWSKCYGGNRNDNASSILCASDSGFYVCGSTKSFGSTTSSAFLMKVDKEGNVLWTKVNSSLDYNSYSSICFNNLGQLVAAGITFNYNTTIQYNLFTSLFDTSGNLISSRRSSSFQNKSIYLNNVFLASNGDVILTGSERYWNSSKDMIIICQESNGNIIWQRKYNQLGEGYSIAEDSLHNFHIAGEYYDGANPYSIPYILSIDRNGYILNASSYFDPQKFSGLRDIMITDDGMISAVGFEGSESRFIKSELNLNSGCHEIQTSTTDSILITIDTSIVNQQFVQMSEDSILMHSNPAINQTTIYCHSIGINETFNNMMAVSPNPTSGKFKIQTNKISSQILQIFNDKGQIVMQKEFGENFVVVDMTNYLPGIYFFTIDNSKGGKIILLGK